MALVDRKEYRIWKAMKARCYAPCYKNTTYQRHGIKVCPEWKASFKAFMDDMGPIPGPDYSIERLDVYGDYTPGNCIWLPLRDQARNRTNCRFYTIDGETHNLKDWSRKRGLKYSTVYMRMYRYDMTVEQALGMKGE